MKILYINQAVYYIFLLILYLAINAIIECIIEIKKRDIFSMSALLNQHLGKKLRLRRTSLGLTQTQVAQAINVTFQQIQKYEKGTNGVSSARLLQLANFLKVEIKFFFEDYQDFSAGNQNEVRQNLNYSFLAKLLSELSSDEKNSIKQLLSADKEFKKVI
jgi:transcriptional regulator with XRE-family HTH domain